MYLLKTHTLSVSTPGENTLGTDGRWTQGAISTKSVVGSLQSSRKGRRQGHQTVKLPEGLHSKDIRYFYTKEYIQVPDEFNSLSSATTQIDGQTFYFFDREDNTGYGLMSDHYVYVLIRQSRVTSGGKL